MNIALVIAGGSGARTGQEIPKQYLTINDKPIIIYTLQRLEKMKEIDSIVVVVSQGWESFLYSYAKQFNISKLSGITFGGATRHQSVLNGIEYLNEKYSENDIVLINDANRPLVPEEVFKSSIDEIRSSGSFTLAGEKCVDTMFWSENAIECNKAINRDMLYKGQTPESGLLGKYNAIFQKAKSDGCDNCSPTELCLKYNKQVKIIAGSSKSFKITTRDDIELFKALLSVKVDNLL